jgi:hypothetical protein
LPAGGGGWLLDQIALGLAVLAWFAGEPPVAALPGALAATGKRLHSQGVQLNHAER